MFDRPLTQSEREEIDRIKVAVRAASTPAERIAAMNSGDPDDIVLALAALLELEEER